jgi:crotonobetainyl-CoA:carnitine CoA-transferase CaiB-like acyl-CoA transferase
VTSTLCKDLVVLEFDSGSRASALAGVLFADAGARVIKVESPEGNRLRQDSLGAFLVFNRGKESLVLDLHTPESRSVALEWIAQADVVIDGFGAGVMDRFGLGYSTVKDINPSLVYVSIKGFGSEGPYSKYKAHEPIVAAKIGLLSPGTTGQHGFRSGPIYARSTIPSFGAGNFAFTSAIAALVVREETGLGQFVESTLAVGTTPSDYFGTGFMQYQAGMLAYSPQSPPPAPAAVKPNQAPQKVYPFSRSASTLCSKDGRWIDSTLLMNHQAVALIKALELDVLLDDPAFQAAPYFDTLEDAEAFSDLLIQRFSEQDMEYWMPRLMVSPDVAFEVFAFSDEGIDHPQIRHNGNVVTVADPTYGTIEEIGPIAIYEKTPITIQKSAPELNEHGALVVNSKLAGYVGKASSASVKNGGPLSGMTIVEWGSFYAMPFGTSILASLGARVIKVEDLKGDPMRFSFGVREGSALKTTEGKESICVNLTTPAGKKIVQDLIANADAFVNGYRPGIEVKMGLDYENLKTINPNLIYLHATGYGTSGPYSKRAVFAGTASALTGRVGRHAALWLDPERSAHLSALELKSEVMPRLFAPTDGDSNAALVVAVAMILALFNKVRTGEGQFVETSMINGNAWAYADEFNRFAARPEPPKTDEEFYGINALSRLYETSEGWLMVVAPTQREWERLAQGVNHPELLADPRFADSQLRLKNDQVLVETLSATFATKPAQEWESILTDLGVGAVKVFDGAASQFTVTDPVMSQTGLVLEVEHPLFGRMKRHGLPGIFSLTPGVASPGCVAGQHTIDLLHELGYSQTEIESFVADQIVTAAQ